MSAMIQLRELTVVEPATLRVAMYDPYPVALAGVKASVEQTSDLTIVVATTRRERLEAMADAGTLDVDLVLVDVVDDMASAAARQDVLTFVRRMSADGRSVVVFGDTAAAGHNAALVSAGASAIVSKRESMGELADVMRRVAYGEPVALPTEALCGSMVSDGHDRGAHETLTARESEIFVLLAECLTPKEVAFELRLALSTVYTHTERIRRKLGVSTLSEIVSYAARWGILDV